MHLSIHSKSFFLDSTINHISNTSAPFKKKGKFLSTVTALLSLKKAHLLHWNNVKRIFCRQKSPYIITHLGFFHFFVWWWMAEILPPVITLLCQYTTISHSSYDYFDPTEPMFWYICLVSSADGSLGRSFSFLLAEVGWTGGSAAFVLADSDLLAVSMVAV